VPSNKLIYYGVIVVAASALLWLGAELARLVSWTLPYAAAAGGVLIVLGVVMEIGKRRAPVEAPSAVESGSASAPAPQPEESSAQIPRT
jgi:hypothetical protein